MPTATCKHRGCKKSFTHPTQMRADQALRMHEGRSHSNVIKTFIPNRNGNGHVSLTRDLEPAKHHGCAKLEQAETDQIVTFIQAHSKEHPSKAACFRAALKETGLEGRIVENSVAVDRFFKKAFPSDEDRPKRKYTRKQHGQIVTQEIKVNFCPVCGCNIHAVATGMAMANQM